MFLPLPPPVLPAPQPPAVPVQEPVRLRPVSRQHLPNLPRLPILPRLQSLLSEGMWYCAELPGLTLIITVMQRFFFQDLPVLGQDTEAFPDRTVLSLIHYLLRSKR